MIAEDAFKSKICDIRLLERESCSRKRHRVGAEMPLLADQWFKYVWQEYTACEAWVECGLGDVWCAGVCSLHVPVRI